MTRRRPWTLAWGAAGALLLGAVAAQASDATLLADRAGFLVGHAHRCGVEEGRVERAASLTKELLGAFSVDDGDKEAAQAQFAERVLASALAELLGDSLPSCAAVRSQLAQFEQHQLSAAPQPSNRGESPMARDERSNAQHDRTAATTKAAKPAKTATTRRDDMTPKRRAALEMRRAAQQERGKPPSI